MFFLGGVGHENVRGWAVREWLGFHQTLRCHSLMKMTRATRLGSDRFVTTPRTVALAIATNNNNKYHKGDMITA